MTNSLAESLKEYTDAFPEEGRLDALHQLFYGFYSRIAVVDRTTHELARWAKDDLTDIENLPPALAEALRDNALHVGRDLFAARMRAMTALRLVSAQCSTTASVRSPRTASTTRAGCRTAAASSASCTTRATTTSWSACRSTAAPDR